MNPSRMSQMTALGADWWNDSGVPAELGEAVALGAVGGTSNPVIVSQAVKAQPALCNPLIDRLLAENRSDTEDDIAWKLIHTLALDAASRLKPVFDATRGAKGWLSAQVNPKYYPSQELMVAQATQLASLAPNIAIKAPATEVGLAAIEEMTVTWNTLFKVAVAYRREVECRRTGDGDRASCHSKYFEMDGDRKRTQMVAFGGWGTDTPKELDVDKKRPLVTTCHNPVRAYDPETCGKAGDAIRLGDVRKNFIIYWPFASRAPYGGVATIGADPVTGEMVGASATIMGRSVTAAAAQVRDIIQLNTGDVKIEDLIEGSQPGLYADRVKDGKVQGPGSMSKAKTPEEIKSAINNIDQASLAKVFAGTKYGDFYRSTDGGRSWVKEWREFSEITAVAWTPFVADVRAHPQSID